MTQAHVFLAGAAALSLAATARAESGPAWRLDDVHDTLVGAALYLESHQITPRPGRGSPLIDSCDGGDGCASALPAHLPGWPGGILLPVAFPRIRNMTGEWASAVNAFPELLGNAHGESPVEVLDSNMFVTANTLLPLFLFDSPSPLDATRARALAHVAKFQRGSAFAFWPQRPSRHGPYTAVAPLNMPLETGRLAFPLRWFAHHTGNAGIEWFSRLLDPRQNPWGMESLANVPDDADDTALALALAAKARMLHDARPMLATLGRYRDVGRTKPPSSAELWKGENSGAFLTWLKDESTPEFARPDEGVIPFGVNNVDCVVNANVLLAAGLQGERSLNGIPEAIALVEKAARTRAWPECGIYYPQQMFFPYAASRAFRDGGIPELAPTMEILLPQLLELQENEGRRHPESWGAFPGGLDETRAFSTALGVTTLLNMGEATAARLGLLERYRESLHTGIRFLSGEKRAVASVTPSRETAFAWDAGLVFSSSIWGFAQWRSAAFSTAIALEAFAKYARGFDLEESPACTLTLQRRQGWPSLQARLQCP